MRILLSLAEPGLRARVAAALSDHEVVTSRQTPPDLVLTDMPDLIPAVREEEACRYAPVVVLLDPMTEEAADAAVAAGASSVLAVDVPEAALRREIAARSNEVRASRVLRGASDGEDRYAGPAFRRLAESGIVGISYFDMQGGIHDANDRYLSMMGATRRDLQEGRLRWDLLTAPEWRERTEEAVAELRSVGRATPYEKEYLRLDGSRVWALFGGAMLTEERGVAFVIDISAQKEVEQALERQAQALARSNEELQGFAYAASHDLREPLRMITIYSQLLRRMYDESLGAQAHEFLEGIVSGVKRMDDLLGALLEYARLGRDDAPSRLPVDCNEVAEEVHIALEGAIREADAWVDYDELPVVLGVPVQVRQLFQNLVSNAIRYRSEGRPEVWIEATPQRGEWLFSVRDNGIGVPPGHETAIFAPFRQLKARDQEGSGMGLAICKRIVERHGGRIWVEPNPEGGSIFRFTLPGASFSEPA